MAPSEVQGTPVLTQQLREREQVQEQLQERDDELTWELLRQQLQQCGDKLEGLMAAQRRVAQQGQQLFAAYLSQPWQAQQLFQK